MTFAIALLSVTVLLCLVQPKIGPIVMRPHVNATLAAAVCWAAGLVSTEDIAVILKMHAMPVLTLVSLMTVTLLADDVDFFERVARKLARQAQGRPRRLLTYLFFAGSALGAIFSNDAAVLIMTPIVWRLLNEIAPHWTERERVPFYFAVLYVANLVGFFVISNPINLVICEFFDIGFTRYALWMVTPALASVVTTYLGVRFAFRRSIADSFSLPKTPVIDPRQAAFRKWVGSALAITLLLVLFEPYTGIPLGILVAGAALVLLSVYALSLRRPVVPILRSVAWDVVVFLGAIFIVAKAVQNSGATQFIGELISQAHQASLSAGLATTTLIAAPSSALLNNHPVANIMALTIAEIPMSDQHSMFYVFAALIGGDLGPKMLPMGSLAALLWFRLLRDRGVTISVRTYVMLGVPVTLLAVVVALIVLLFEIRLFA